MLLVGASAPLGGTVSKFLQIVLLVMLCSVLVLAELPTRAAFCLLLLLILSVDDFITTLAQVLLAKQATVSFLMSAQCISSEVLLTWCALQVRIEGQVEKLSAVESDAYFHRCIITTATQPTKLLLSYTYMQCCSHFILCCDWCSFFSQNKVAIA